MRYRAALELGWSEVPAVLDILTEEEARLRALRDNNHAGEYDELGLAEVTAWLEEAGADLDLALFDTSALSAALDASGGTDAFTAPEPREEKNTNLDPGEGRYKEQYGVICIVGSAAEQEEVYTRLKDEGYNVRVVTT